MKEKHLVVVSVDAMVFEDLEYARTLPAFSRLLNEGSLIERVKTIYPSLTHPVHATIMSGCPAGVTGVVCNEVFEPFNEVKRWYNYLDEVHCDTIYHAAKRAGLTTAAISWPVTSCGQEYIDYLVPCALTADFYGLEDRPLDAYRKLGAQEFLMDIIADAVDKYTWANAHPEVDNFMIHCACEVIKRYKPNLLMTHPSLVDSTRHRTGIFSDAVKDAVKETDKWLGMLMDALTEAGIYETTDFIVVSDHGQLNINRRISPNVFLADKGYIKVDEDGKLLSYDAFIQSAGLSAQVYLSRPDDKKLYDEIYKLLSEMAEEGIYGFERVFTVDEVKETYGLSGDFSFVLESDGFTSISEEWVRPVVRTFDLEDYRFGHATHGHMPEKGPQPPFLAAGPSIKKGVTIPTGSIYNHAPTFAKILGVELKDAWGKAVDEILK